MSQLHLPTTPLDTALNRPLDSRQRMPEQPEFDPYALADLAAEPTHGGGDRVAAATLAAIAGGFASIILVPEAVAPCLLAGAVCGLIGMLLGH